MKKLLLLLPAVALMLCACSKDEDKDKDYVDNKVTIGTQTFDFDTNDSEIELYGDVYSTESDNYALRLFMSNDYLIFLDITTPAGITDLSHSYPFCTLVEAEAGKTWATVSQYSGYGHRDAQEPLAFKSGSVNVAHDTGTNVFTVTVDCTLADNTPVKGRYKGLLLPEY